MEKDVLARIIEAERQIQECLNDQRAKAREWLENLGKEAEEDFAQEQIGMKESLGEAARTAQRLAETKAATIIKAAEEKAARVGELDDAALKRAVMARIRRIVPG